MSTSNFERMIALAENSFDAKNDPNQLDVNEDVIHRLLQIHPNAVIEKDDGNGPVIWIILIPTTKLLMEKFLENQISEKELFENTHVDIFYDAIYLCSAITLEEYRLKGITKNLCIEAIEGIRKDNPISSIFVWSFSKEGECLAEKIAAKTQLSLFKKLVN
jgi:hypothetical protein